uniref:Lar family restriction alleviation protein n=1 Tax=Pseudomonas fulva TaxID=47880 RepID=UPI002852DA1B|nr:Lar family restriction alleviation protein [Pseudomonas fulva]
MPTENRSSNTEMAAQLSPCPFCGQQDAFVEQLDSDASVVICQGRIDEHSACLARGPVRVQQHECEDQPGHDQAVKEWNKRAAALLHPDPIAWMVGTAFWWTKEEAERDAEATGLPITDVLSRPKATSGLLARCFAGSSAARRSGRFSVACATNRSPGCALS